MLDEKAGAGEVTEQDVVQDVVDAIAKSALAAAVTEGGDKSGDKSGESEESKAVEMIEEPFLCKDCKHYWQVRKTADVQQTSLDGELVAGHVLTEILRWCVYSPGQTLDLSDTGVYECNRFQARDKELKEPEELKGQKE